MEGFGGICLLILFEANLCFIWVWGVVYEVLCNLLLLCWVVKFSTLFRSNLRSINLIPPPDSWFILLMFVQFIGFYFGYVAVFLVLRFVHSQSKMLKSRTLVRVIVRASVCGSKTIVHNFYYDSVNYLVCPSPSHQLYSVKRVPPKLPIIKFWNSPFVL